ncbi:MAG TPA: POTRA domain-containing protein [Bryobacteraceae bacterium]
MKCVFGLLGGLAAAVILRAGGGLAPAGPATVSQVTIEGAPAAFPLETKAGEPLNETKIEHDVKALWAARRPYDVRVEEQPDGDASSTMRVIFHVEERHTVTLRKITVDPPTPGIRAGVEPGQQIDAEMPQRIATELRKQLVHSGFPDAKVDADLVPARHGKADLLINIEKGRAVDVKTVTFSGDLGVKEKDLRGVLRATKPTTILPRVPGVWNGWHILRGYNEDTVPADIGNLKSFYYRHGFFDADVTAAPVDASVNQAHVDFDIDAGSRYAVRSFTLSGPDGERPIGGLKLPGENIRGQMDAACHELLAERRKYERTGVLDFEARIEVREAPAPEGIKAPAPDGAGPGLKWADLRATIEAGPAYETGRITFKGNKRFSESVLRGALKLDEGDPLDQMKLRKSLARLNQTGFFEPLSERDVIVSTPPKAGPADITIWVKEKKARSWSFSGPVGPMSVAGPLEFAIGSRLPSWGQGAFDLSTFLISAKFFYFAKPIGALLPFLPNKRFVPLLELSRPLLPGQTFLSGVTIIPQLGWQGMLFSYGASQVRTLTRGIFESDRNLTPPLPVTIVHGHDEGTMLCEPPKTAGDWMKQIGGTLFNLGFSFFPI